MIMSANAGSYFDKLSMTMSANAGSYFDKLSMTMSGNEKVKRPGVG
jgi:hypothetical protein